MTRPLRPRTAARRISRRRAAFVLAVAGALAALTACGGSSGNGDAAATTTTSSPPATSEGMTSGSPSTASGSAQAKEVTVTAVDFSFQMDEDSFPAGTYTFTLMNEGNATHDLVIQRDGQDVGGTDMINPGEQASVTVDLQPGEYLFYCSVDGHRQMGMEMKVTVT